jgi:hypothetical protein
LGGLLWASIYSDMNTYTYTGDYGPLYTVDIHIHRGLWAFIYSGLNTYTYTYTGDYGPLYTVA